MKREILFKGQRKDTKEWIEGFYGYKIECENHFIIKEEINQHFNSYFVDYEVSEQTVGQYTGTTDCNNIKIFEGDILQKEHPTHNNKYIVRWSEGNCGFVGEPMKPDKIWPSLNPGSTRHLKVIGNIHDNAE